MLCNSIEWKFSTFVECRLLFFKLLWFFIVTTHTSFTITITHIIILILTIFFLIESCFFSIHFMCFVFVFWLLQFLCVLLPFLFILKQKRIKKQFYNNNFSFSFNFRFIYFICPLWYFVLVSFVCLVENTIKQFALHFCVPRVRGMLSHYDSGNGGNDGNDDDDVLIIIVGILLKTAMH